MIWHDVKNDLIINRYLATLLISDVAYSQKTCTEAFSDILISSGLLTISVVSHLIPKSGSKDKRLRNEFMAKHRPSRENSKLLAHFKVRQKSLNTRCKKSEKNRLKKKQWPLFRQRSFNLAKLSDQLGKS